MQQNSNIFKKNNINQVDLRDNQIFEISSDEEDYDANENELLNVRDLREFKSLADDEKKYESLHYHVANDNRRENAEKIVNISRNSHFYPSMERNVIDEEKRFVVGFQEALDKVENFILKSF